MTETKQVVISLVLPKTKDPISFLKKWGLFKLLHGPAFRLRVAGLKNADLEMDKIKAYPLLKVNPAYFTELLFYHIGLASP